MQKGYTTIELVVVIAIIAALSGIVALMSITAVSKPKQQFASLENVDNARIMASRFVNEIRSAIPGVNASAAISLANDSEIIFYSPAAGPGDSVKKIRYYVSDNKLYKAVTAPTGVPLAYTNPPSVSLIQSDLALGGNPLFYYYNGNYDGTTEALSQPVNLNHIRFVKINLTVLKQTTQGSQDTFSLNVGAAVRSLKNNLGE